MWWRAWPTLLAGVIASLALVACEDEGSAPATPTLSPATIAIPSPTATPAAGIGSYDDPHDFRSFAAQLATAIGNTDVQFFLDKVVFEELICANEFTAPPSCAGQPPETTIPGIVVGVWQSEGFGLDADGYEEFIREFLTEFEAGAADVYGDAKPQLYAYAIFRPDLVPPMAQETVQAIATRIAPAEPPAFPSPARRVLLFGVSFDGQRWHITHMSTGPAVGFLNPTSPEAETALGDVFQFWARWEGASP